VIILSVNIGNKLILDTAGTPVVNKYIDIAQLVGLILKNSITLAGIILLSLFFFGGISYIMSAGSGDAKKTAQAQDAITSAVIGFLVIFTSYFIIQIIEIITGIPIL